MSENSSSSESVRQETQYAVWQRAYRARKRAGGFKLVSAWVPHGEDARVRRALKAIIFQCHSQTVASFLSAIERICSFCGDGHVVTVWHDAGGWHVRNAGPRRGRSIKKCV